jgi:DNA primase large subunit
MFYNFLNKIFFQEYAASLRTEAKSQHLTEFLDVLDKRGKKASPEVLRNRSKDHFSHFILRLAYCRTEELRKW